MTNDIERGAPSEARKWGVALALAGVYAFFAGVYLSFVLDRPSLLLYSSAVSAIVASFLFATSFSLGSTSYYTGFPNMRHGYQKQIGVLAFWLCVYYCVTLLVLYPETYRYGFFDNIFTVDITLGLLAMFIFGAMVGINSKWVAPFFNWETIKFVLQLGYIGYALLVMRAAFIEWDLWEAWFLSLDGFPPTRLSLSILAVLVLLLRLSVSIHQRIAGDKEK